MSKITWILLAIILVLGGILVYMFMKSNNPVTINTTYQDSVRFIRRIDSLQNIVWQDSIKLKKQESAQVLSDIHSRDSATNHLIDSLRHAQANNLSPNTPVPVLDSVLANCSCDTTR